MLLLTCSSLTKNDAITDFSEARMLHMLKNVDFDCKKEHVKLHEDF